MFAPLREQLLRDATANAGVMQLTPNKCVTRRATSRRVTLCLGGMTDALRDSVAKRIAGWDSDYRAMDQGLSGTPRSGPPGRGRPRENFRKFPARAGPAGGRPGDPILGPPGPPKWAKNGPFLGPF